MKALPFCSSSSVISPEVIGSTATKHLIGNEKAYYSESLHYIASYTLVQGVTPKR